MNKYILSLCLKYSSLQLIYDYVRISEGRMSLVNNVMTVNCPTDIDVEVTALASKVLTAYKSNSSVKITPTGKLSIKTGRLSTLIPTTQDEYPEIDFPREYVDIPFMFYDLITVLKEFTGKDENQPWAKSIIVKDGVVYATNNICVVWAPCEFLPDCMLQPNIVNVLIKCRKDKWKIHVGPNAISIMSEDTTFVKFASLDYKIPDLTKARQLFSREDLVQIDYPDEVYEGLKELKAFHDSKDFNKVYCLEEGLSTGPEGAESSTYNYEGLNPAIFSAKVLEDVFKHGVCVWMGGGTEKSYFECQYGIEGVFMGLRA